MLCGTHTNGLRKSIASAQRSDYMKIGIVGHGADKFTAQTEQIAKCHINRIIKLHMPCTVISGESPVGGVDIWAHEIADEMGAEFIPCEPRQHKWDAEYGFKQRNIDIAIKSNIVYCIVVRELPKSYKGVKYTDYHCNRREHTKPDGEKIEKHVKSGGCWTAWYAIEHEGRAEWVLI